MTISTYTGDASRTLFPITFPYISREFVKVFVDGVAVADPEYSNDSTILLSPPPADGTQVLIYRETPTTPLVDLTAQTYNIPAFSLALKQSLHVAEEMEQLIGDVDAATLRNILGLGSNAAARATLGLGSAANLNAPSSLQDTSSTSTLRPGSFGIGGGLNSAPDYIIPDLDATNTPTGVYATSSITVGTFPNAGRFGVLTVDRYASGLLMQSLSVAGTNEVWVRQYWSTGGWQAWSLLFGSYSVRNSAGAVPAGLLIEHTVGANGHTVRFNDGTQICHHTIALPAPTTAFGAVYTTAPTAWTFGRAFSSAPVVTAGANNDLANVGIAAPSATGVNLRPIGYASGTPVTASLMAIGRWR